MKWITWGLLTVLLFLQYQIWFHHGGLREEYAQMQKKAEKMHMQNAELRRQNAMLKAQVADLQNGYDAISEIARTEMGYIGKGETFYNLNANATE